MGYTNTLTAKTDYHRLVTKLVDEQRQAQRLQDTHAHLYQIRRQGYEQAKDDTRIWYADAKLLLMVNDRYRRLSAGTNKLLDLHQQQATYMWRQQTHLTAMAQYYQDACKHKTTQYWQTTRPARRTIYLAYPGFAEICILHRTWSTVALGTYELAFLIKKKSFGQGNAFGQSPGVETLLLAHLDAVARNLIVDSLCAHPASAWRRLVRSWVPVSSRLHSFDGGKEHSGRTRYLAGVPGLTRG